MLYGTQGEELVKTITCNFFRCGILCSSVLVSENCIQNNTVFFFPTFCVANRYIFYDLIIPQNLSMNLKCVDGHSFLISNWFFSFAILRPYLVNLLPCLTRISKRPEESVQETLAAAIPKIMAAFGNFANDNEIKVSFFNLLMLPVTSQSTVSYWHYQSGVTESSVTAACLN